MHKLLISISLFLITWQSANAKPIFNEFSTEILEINGANAIIKDSDNIVLGSSGIVTHTFKDGISTIVARADVIKKDGNRATIRFDEYKLSTQTAFPKPEILPAVGDKVTLNYLYNRALIVAPNHETYKEITEHFKDIDWVHPDIVGAYLAKISRPNPNRETFQKVCEINSTGLIFFALNNRGHFVDCNNFISVKEIKTGYIKKAQIPFYTRIRGIEASWFNWSSSKITNFNSYYRSLIDR